MHVLELSHQLWSTLTQGFRRNYKNNNHLQVSVPHFSSNKLATIKEFNEPCVRS